MQCKQPWPPTSSSIPEGQNTCACHGCACIIIIDSIYIIVLAGLGYTGLQDHDLPYLELR